MVGIVKAWHLCICCMCKIFLVLKKYEFVQIAEILQKHIFPGASVEIYCKNMFFSGSQWKDPGCMVQWFTCWTKERLRYYLKSILQLRIIELKSTCISALYHCDLHAVAAFESEQSKGSTHWVSFASVTPLFSSGDIPSPPQHRWYHHLI